MKETRLLIERIQNSAQITNNQDREIIGEIPLMEGPFLVETRFGILVGEVCPVDTSRQQKVIFEGEVLPTIHKRGKQRYQQSERRRVVNVPLTIEKRVTQEAGTLGILEFRRTRLPEQATIFSDVLHLGGNYD